MSKLDFYSQDEKDIVEQVFRNSVLCLNEEDRSLPGIELMLPLLQRGIAIHHSGLLSIIKELVELLFQEGLVKALFATETFAMGLNMPAKSVVFTAIKKFDGDSHRYIGSGEYIQMRGRAGCRGKDDCGICIVMIDEQMEMNALRDMVLGKLAPLVSTFRLSYYSILNLMCRAEGQFSAEHVIRHSIHQFQYEKVPVQLPLIAALSKLRISIPPDLRPVEARQSILLAVQELERRFPQGLPKLNPVKDTGIEEKEIVELVSLIEELEQKLFVHPVHKMQDVQQVKCFQKKAEVKDA